MVDGAAQVQRDKEFRTQNADPRGRSAELNKVLFTHDATAEVSDRFNCR